MKEHIESVKHLSNIEKLNGTIIDLETLFEPCKDKYKPWESEGYIKKTIICLGYLNKERIKIYCCETLHEYNDLNKKIKNGVLTLQKPYYAFQHYFEKYVLKHNCELDIIFEGELNQHYYEKKENAINKLNISNFDDPFDGNGGMCMNSFNQGNIENVIKHNRSCLLKEYEILMKRGFRKINGNFIEKEITRFN